MKTKHLPIIGNSVRITVAGIKDVPAKVDTGAESSSIWASNIVLTPENQLEFCLFAPGSEFYTGEVLKTQEFRAMQVRNSTGQISIRYRVHLSTVIEGKRIKVGFTLADRSRNNFPVLLGRRMLNNKFLVDVSRLDVPYPTRTEDMMLNDELDQDPQKFHQKYMEKK